MSKLKGLIEMHSKITMIPNIQITKRIEKAIDELKRSSNVHVLS